MYLSPPPSLAERFVQLVEGLSKAVAGRGARNANRINLPLLILPGPLVVLIWRYVRRIGTRVAVILARIQAGTQRTRRDPLATPPPKRCPPPLPHPAMRGIGWLGRLVPEARFGGSHLRHILSQPEMADLVAEHKQLRRALRPLCRMLNVALPPLRVSPPISPPPAPAPAIQPKRAARRVTKYPPGLVPVPQRWRLQPLPEPPRRGARGPPFPA